MSSPLDRVGHLDRFNRHQNIVYPYNVGAVQNARGHGSHGPYVPLGRFILQDMSDKGLTGTTKKNGLVQGMKF